MAENHRPGSEHADEVSDQPLRIDGLLHYSVHMFAQFAWQRMGLLTDPVTGKSHEDLSQARIAIDVLSRLAEHLDPMLGDQERRDLQNLLSDLRINLARKSAGG
ncbi:MAG: hypothetical protein C4341_04255 [Armatimonadota bacterium]